MDTLWRWQAMFFLLFPRKQTLAEGVQVMTSFSRAGVRPWLRAALVMVWVALPALLRADDSVSKFITKSAPADADATTVDLFDGIANGDLGVKVIPKDSTQGKVLIENKTDKPLSVKLPDAFAAVPVLAQQAPGGQQGGGGGGAQAGGGGMGGGQQGGGMFNIPPEKIAQIKVPLVCLEHGKAEPRAGIPYELKPIQSVTDNPEVQELCRMLGTGQLDQRSAQVAAWHLANGLSWDYLARKQLRHADGTSEPYFTDAQIRGGVNLAALAAKGAEQRKQDQQKQQPSSSASTSASQN